MEGAWIARDRQSSHFSFFAIFASFFDEPTEPTARPKTAKLHSHTVRTYAIRIYADARHANDARPPAASRRRDAEAREGADQLPSLAETYYY